MTAARFRTDILRGTPQNGARILAKVTLADIAAAAGVSLATVDRVINGRGGVRADREARVLRAARDLGLDRRLPLTPTTIKRVAVLIQPPGNPFHAELAAGIATMRATYRAMNLQLQIHHIDQNAPAVTARQIARLAGTCDGIIISGPDTEDVAAAWSAVARAVPVVTLATDIPGSGRHAYVGPDDERAGRVAGDLIGRFLGPDGGEVLQIAGRLDIAGQRARARAIAAVLGRYYPRATLVEVVETGERRDATETIVRSALRRHPGLRAIYHTTTGAGGIVRALADAGRTASVTVVTHELTETRRRLLRARQLDAVIDQNPRLEVRVALETMARLLGRLAGEAGSVSTEIQIHMAENA